MGHSGAKDPCHRVLSDIRCDVCQSVPGPARTVGRWLMHRRYKTTSPPRRRSVSTGDTAGKPRPRCLSVSVRLSAAAVARRTSLRAPVGVGRLRERHRFARYLTSAGDNRGYYFAREIDAVHAVVLPGLTAPTRDSTGISSFGTSRGDRLPRRRYGSDCRRSHPSSQRLPANNARRHAPDAFISHVGR